ncbi:hypothetical protein FH609_021595 [Streptomyces sp. 3MP-14]|uniref:Transmembrane protein n=1 Tax=Streptomyces mimosae TaxID=2586635 RepID=A0A5N6A7G2_9ACTN|nr:MULTISPECIES: hypothetical protein [Streptomyces]KAB8163388.1 hypothetical protein FH607_019010 [Streptomyces mimosae]KAB8174665.1 hypothetical protein FH609_021595 [Streptomyces sp. 3MP-14]
MNSPVELPAGDRSEVERVLEEALRAARLAADVTPERVARLRELALAALPEILVSAEPQYRRFAALRERLREADGRERGAGAPAPRDGRRGSGGLLVAFALIPVLAGISAVIFLLLGYALRLASPEPAVAASMRSVGWAFALFTAVGALVAVGALWVAAVRNGSTSIRASAPAASVALTQEVAVARAEWRRALLDQGFNPLLRRELADAPPPEGRTPRLRYSSPHFSSPEFSSGDD